MTKTYLKIMFILGTIFVLSTARANDTQLYEMAQACNSPAINSDLKAYESSKEFFFDSKRTAIALGLSSDHMDSAKNQLRNSIDKLYESAAEHAVTQYMIDFEEFDCFVATVKAYYARNIRIRKTESKSPMGEPLFVVYESESPIKSDLNRKDLRHYMVNALAPALFNDTMLVNHKIRWSIRDYAEPCPCPYSKDSNNLQCGDRSAYVRFGGAFPKCFPNDVSREEINKLREFFVNERVTTQNPFF